MIRMHGGQIVEKAEGKDLHSSRPKTVIAEFGRAITETF